MGTRNFFLSPQSQFRNLKKALPKPQFRNFWRNVTPQPQLRNCNFFWSPQLERFNSAIFGTFSAVESGRFMGAKNQRSKISCYCPFQESFRFPEKQRILKIFFVDFWNHLEMRKRDKKVADWQGDCGKLRNCGSQILKVCNHRSATFFSPQLCNRSGCPQYCGVADLNCGCPPLLTTLGQVYSIGVLTWYHISAIRQTGVELGSCCTILVWQSGWHIFVTLFYYRRGDMSSNEFFLKCTLREAAVGSHFQYLYSSVDGAGVPILNTCNGDRSRKKEWRRQLNWTSSINILL